MEIYLDNSATTPLEPCVAQFLQQLYAQEYGNPSSLHSRGFSASLVLEKARQQLAGVLACRTDEIFFTGGGTEANNLALLGLAAANARKKGSLVASAGEHASVLQPLRHLAEQGWQLTLIPLLPDGSPDTAGLVAAVQPDTLLVSAGLVNSETGALLDVASLSRGVKAANPATLLHCDAVQGFARLELCPARAGVDLLTLSGHKIGAPKGVGALYKRKGLRILPLLQGGGQEGGLRPGTENPPAIGALGLAAEQMFARRAQQLENWRTLNEYFFTKIKQISNSCRNSPFGHAPYIMNISLVGLRSETVIHFLADKGIYISGGSACSRGARSAVLQSMGLPLKQIDSALRISMGVSTTAQQLDELVLALEQARQQLATAG